MPNIISHSPHENPRHTVKIAAVCRKDSNKAGETTEDSQPPHGWWARGAAKTVQWLLRKLPWHQGRTRSHSQVWTHVRTMSVRKLVHRFTAPFFRITVTWKQPKYPPTDECVDKLRWFHTVECYSAVIHGPGHNVDGPHTHDTHWKNTVTEDAVLSATTWMELECNLEGSKSEK